MISKHVALALTLGLLGATGCTKEATRPRVEAPALPPSASMKIDLSFFGASSRAARVATQSAAEGATIFNWTNATVRVLVINAFVDAALEPPFQAIEAALSTDPVQQSDGSWLWTFGIRDAGREIRIDLEGRPSGSEVAWKLFATDSGAPVPLEHDLWFEGTSSEHAGTWLFHDPATPNGLEVARLEWRYQNDRDAELSLEGLDTRGDGLGDRLTYGVDGDEASVIFRDGAKGQTMSMVWNTADGSGSLTAPDYNGGRRACWDEHQRDAECDPAVVAR